MRPGPARAEAAAQARPVGLVPSAPVMAVMGPMVTFTEFPIPTMSSPGGICAGPDGRVTMRTAIVRRSRPRLDRSRSQRQRSNDAVGRPSQVQDPLGRTFTLSYDADGDRTQIAYPNTTNTMYAYDERNRLTSLTTVQSTAPPTTVASFAYTLDEAGRRTQLSEADGTVRSYAYDSIDRLTGETVTGSLNYAKTFAYDPVGNRLTQTTIGAGAATVHYAYDVRDRLMTENATTYAYDANGNVTSKSGEAAYTWDFEDRLARATMTSGPMVAHVYDAEGNRLQTSVTPSGGGAAVTTNMLVATGRGLSQVVAETDSGGNVRAVYVRAGDELLEVMRPGSTLGTWTTKFVHHDGLGSVRALTDESGTVSDTRAYEAFGTKNVEAGNDALAYGFAGEPFQAESMLAYHRARWMDGRVGRFVGMDQAEGDQQRPLTLHRYVYTGDEPVDRGDPNGWQDSIVDVGLDSCFSEPSFQMSSGVTEDRTWSFELYLRLFAPWQTFGGGFGGDARGFTTDLNVTSRVAAEITLQAPNLMVTDYSVASSPSSWGWFTATARSSAAVGWQPGHLEVDIAAANPLVPFAPNIDATLDVYGGGASGGELCLSGDLSGDAFPDAEVFTRSLSGNATWLVQFATGGGQQNGPSLFLPGLNTLPMGSFQNVCINEY